MKNEKAFPCEEWIYSDDPKLLNPVYHPGMDLRDYFAIHADTSEYEINESDLAFKMIGKNKPLNYPQGIESIEWSLKLEAALRYMFADAMMEARNEKV